MKYDIESMIVRGLEFYLESLEKEVLNTIAMKQIIGLQDLDKSDNQDFI